MKDMSELKKISFPAPIYKTEGRKKNVLTDMVVVSLSKRADGLVYIVQNNNTREVMSIHESYWPDGWTLDAEFTNERTRKPRLKNK